MASKLSKLTLCLSLAAALTACDSQSPEQKVEALRAAAAEHIAAGKYQSAVIELKNALQVRPDTAEVRHQLGNLYLKLGDPVSALKELERASALGLDTPEVIMGRARAHLLLQDNAAVLDLVKAPAADAPLPEDAAPGPYAMRARALVGDGQLDAAVDLALKVLRIEDHPDARLALAVVAAQRGNTQNMMAQAHTVLDLRPDDLQALWLLALGQVRSNDKPAARATLERMRTQLWWPVKADLLTVSLALDAGDREYAWKVLDRLEKTAAQNPDAQLYIAIAALEREQYEKARMTAETLLGRYPNVPRAVFVAGAANLELGNYVLARDYLERFVRTAPDDARAAGMLARAEAAAKRMVAARDNVATDPEAQSEQFVDAQPDPTERQVATIADDDFEAGGLQEPEAPDAEDLRARVAEILAMVKRQEFDAARTAVEELKAQMPDDATPRELEALVMWGAGARAEAVAAMTALQKETPASVARTTNLSQMQRAMDAPEAALETIQRARAAGAEDLRLHREAARAYAMLNDAQGAFEEFRGALALDPDNLRIRAVIARYHLQQGDPQAVLDIMETAPAAAADDPELVRLQAQANLNLGRREETIALLRHLTEIQPEDPVAYQQIGELLLGMGRPAEAVAPLKTARLLSDEALAPSLRLGRALLESGETAAVGALIDELKTAHAEDPRVLVLIGNYALSVEQDVDAAEQAFRQAFERDPSEARLTDLVALMTRVGRFDDAIDAIETWRAAHSTGLSTEATLGELYIANGDAPAAVEVYQGLVARAPETVAYRNNLAWLLKEQGQLEGAQEHVTAALDRAPDNANVLDTAGMIALARGDLSTAVKRLAEAAAAAPENAEIQLNYAEALLSAKNGGTAREILAGMDRARVPERLHPRLDALSARSADPQ
ncbi:tetratricopeptide repeat protein [Rhodovibrio salinarum]|nr:tetratricopeptide repeat protein [Rhodovibrio salinarum]